MVTVKMQIRKNISKVKYMFLFVFSPIAAGAWKREMYMCLEGEGWAFTIQCIVSDLFFTIF